MTPILEMKLQHWRAFQAENGWKGAPMLEFHIEQGGKGTIAAHRNPKSRLTSSNMNTGDKSRAGDTR